MFPTHGPLTQPTPVVIFTFSSSVKSLICDDNPHTHERPKGSGSSDAGKLLTFSLALSYAAAHAGPKLGMVESPTGGGSFGYVSGKIFGIELSDGVGMGLNVYDVIGGLRTLPIVKKPPDAAGGSSEVAGDGEGEVVEYPMDMDEATVDNELLDGGSVP